MTNAEAGGLFIHEIPTWSHWALCIAVVSERGSLSRAAQMRGHRALRSSCSGSPAGGMPAAQRAWSPGWVKWDGREDGLEPGEPTIRAQAGLCLLAGGSSSACLCWVSPGGLSPSLDLRFHIYTRMRWTLRVLPAQISNNNMWLPKKDKVEV